MRSFALKLASFVIYFIVFFAIINAVYLGIILKTDFDFRNRMESIQFEDPDFELLVIGASTSFDAFDTQLLNENGYKSYNLAMGGTTLKTNLIQLEEYLTSYPKKPSRVVLGLNSAMVTTFDEEHIHPIIEVTMKDHKYKLRDVPVLKFKWLGFEFLKKIVSKPHRQAELVLGQLKFEKSIPDQTDYREQFLDIGEYQSSVWIGKIAEFCHQHNLELLIFEMPGYRQTQNISEMGPYNIIFPNGYEAELYNLNSMEFCSNFEADKDWIGNSHLNESGAIKFTYEVIDVLNSRD